MGHDTCGDHGGTNRDGGPCGQPAGYGTDFDEGKCKHHRGTSPDGSSHKGNQNAAKHGAWSESFVEDFLTEEEIERVRKAEDLLGTPEDAQDLAASVAAVALEQFRRSGDERFLRRYESICDTFGIAPADELELSGDVGVEGEFVVDFEDTDT